MKGATIAHAKQRVAPGRYIGISEPGIIAAESPNPIVNELIIMPDIEKRLEAFIRLGHGIVIFPGGVGTAEEILYLLGILLNPANSEQPLPVVLTGPKSSEAYFRQIDEFIGLTLGENASQRYTIVIDDPPVVAELMAKGLNKVREYRIACKDAFYFNWLIEIGEEFQIPFQPTHDNMENLRLNREQPVYERAADLRRAFSGIVAGNVKPDGLRAIREQGLFRIRGEKVIMEALDRLLASFVEHNRMRLPGTTYTPCYQIVA
jgi:predicted Rossmann-fold nucleotide-binding protein